MWHRILYFAALALYMSGGEAFCPSMNMAGRLSSQKAASAITRRGHALACSRVPQLRQRNLVARMAVVEADEDYDASESFVPGVIPENILKSKSLDDWFAQLGHAENAERTYAGAAIAQLHDRDGKEEAIIDRLFGMLTLKEQITHVVVTPRMTQFYWQVLHRRAAVQCLGMIGKKILPRTSNLMLTTSDMTTRASCSKVMGAVALRNPSGLADFPQDALDGIKKAVTEIPDPVTKVASMSALAQIAGGDMANGYQGCERALNLIIELGMKTDDVSLLLSVVNALASICRSNPQWKTRILDTLEDLQKAGEKIDGFQMVDNILNTQLNALSGGTRGGLSKDSGMGFAEGFSWGKKDEDSEDDDDEDWDSVKESMSRK